jgi:hypothetical protein
MSSLVGFDASTVEPRKAFEPIPADTYVAAIVASEMRPNKARTGTFLELVLQILDGEFKNRRLWARLNLEHPNPTVVEIAKAELSAICRAVEVLVPTDSTELHNIPLMIRVRTKKRTDTGEFVNEIAGYQPMPTASSPATMPSMPPSMPSAMSPALPPPPSCPASTVPPWQRA